MTAMTPRDWICPGCLLEAHDCHARKPTAALALPGGALLIGRQSAAFATGNETKVLAACACGSYGRCSVASTRTNP